MLESPHDIDTVHCVKLYALWTIQKVRTWTQEAALSSPKIERRIPTDEKR